MNYNLDLNKITFLSKEAVVNLKEKDISFLRETGLPKIVDSLDFGFDLLQIKKYSCIGKSEDDVSNFLYKIGGLIPVGTFIAIQESDGVIYEAHKPIYENPEIFLKKGVYINSNIEYFARCLNIYDSFYIDNKYVMDDNDLKTANERQRILIELEEALKNIDNTVVGSAPGELDYDGLWTYVIEQMYDVFGIDTYQ